MAQRLRITLFVLHLSNILPISYRVRKDFKYVLNNKHNYTETYSSLVFNMFLYGLNNTSR